jgi:hypothetical protein
MGADIFANAAVALIAADRGNAATATTATTATGLPHQPPPAASPTAVRNAPTILISDRRLSDRVVGQAICHDLRPRRRRLGGRGIGPYGRRSTSRRSARSVPALVGRGIPVALDLQRMDSHDRMDQRASRAYPADG